MEVGKILDSIQGGSWVTLSKILQEHGYVSVKNLQEDDDAAELYSTVAQKLPAEEQVIYGVDAKEESLHLEPCPVCHVPIKTVALTWHYDNRHKNNFSEITEKAATPVASESRKRRAKQRTKYTYEDEIESSSAPSTPSAVVIFNDMHETIATKVSNIESVTSPACMEVFSEGDSKPPTPGPQDLYEGFSVPTTNDLSTTACTFPSTYSSKNYGNFSQSAVLPLNRDAGNNSNNTVGGHGRLKSLLEAQLTGEPKPSVYVRTLQTASGGLSQQDKLSGKRAQPYRSFTSAESANETRISIPISAIQPDLLKSCSSPYSSSSSQNTDNSSSLVTTDKVILRTPPPAPPSESGISSNDSEVHLSPKRKKSRRSRAKQKPVYDPDKHCGVLTCSHTGALCLHSLTCRTHNVSSKRAVVGRSKPFDILLNGRGTKDSKRKKSEYAEKSDQSEVVSGSSSINLPDRSFKIKPSSVKSVNSDTVSISNTENMTSITFLSKSGSIPKTLKGNDSLNNSKRNVFSSSRMNIIIHNIIDTNKPPTVKMITSKICPYGLENIVGRLKICTDMMVNVGGVVRDDSTKITSRKYLQSFVVKLKSSSECASVLPNDGSGSILRKSKFIFPNISNVSSHRAIYKMKQAMKESEESRKAKAMLLRRRIKHFVKRRQSAVKNRNDARLLDNNIKMNLIAGYPTMIANSLIRTMALGGSNGGIMIESADDEEDYQLFKSKLDFIGDSGIDSNSIGNGYVKSNDLDDFMNLPSYIEQDLLNYTVKEEPHQQQQSCSVSSSSFDVDPSAIIPIMNDGTISQQQQQQQQQQQDLTIGDNDAFSVSSFLNSDAEDISNFHSFNFNANNGDLTSVNDEPSFFSYIVSSNVENGAIVNSGAGTEESDRCYENSTDEFLKALNDIRNVEDSLRNVDSSGVFNAAAGAGARSVYVGGNSSDLPNLGTADFGGDENSLFQKFANIAGPDDSTSSVNLAAAGADFYNNVISSDVLLNQRIIENTVTSVADTLSANSGGTAAAASDVLLKQRIVGASVSADGFAPNDALLVKSASDVHRAKVNNGIFGADANSEEDNKQHFLIFGEYYKNISESGDANTVVGAGGSDGAGMFVNIGKKELVDIFGSDQISMDAAVTGVSNSVTVNELSSGNAGQIRNNPSSGDNNSSFKDYQVVEQQQQEHLSFDTQLFGSYFANLTASQQQTATASANIIPCERFVGARSTETAEINNAGNINAASSSNDNDVVMKDYSNSATSCANAIQQLLETPELAPGQSEIGSYKFLSSFNATNTTVDNNGGSTTKPASAEDNSIASESDFIMDDNTDQNNSLSSMNWY